MDIFCKIVNNELPSYTLYEDDIVKVFLDVNPMSPGHMLIIPKKHFENLDDIDIEDEANQKLVVKQLLKEKGFSTKKIDKLVSRYEEAGLLEDEAQDALEDLKEIKEEKKKQLLEDQKKAYQI